MKPSGRRDSSRVPRLASLPLSELLCVPLHSWCKQPSETSTASHDKGILGLHWRQKIKELFHKHKIICLRKPLAVWFSDVVYVYNGSFNNCGEKKTSPWVLHCCFPPPIVKRFVLAQKKLSRARIQVLRILYKLNMHLQFGRYDECSLAHLQLHAPYQTPHWCLQTFVSKTLLRPSPYRTILTRGRHCTTHMTNWIPTCI